MKYGDLTILDDFVASFQGAKANGTASRKRQPITPMGLVPQRDIPLWTLHQQLIRAKTTAQRSQLHKQIAQMRNNRKYVDKVVSDIVSRLVPKSHHDRFLNKPVDYPMTQLDCHQKATRQFSTSCFSFAQNHYAMKHSSVLSNLCEVGMETYKITDAIVGVCSKLTDKPHGVE